MGSFTLPFQQTATKLNADATAFEVDSQAVGAIAIAGKVSGGLSIGVYGEIGGPYPAKGLQQIELLGAVAGQTNQQYVNAVCGASQFGNGVSGISDSGIGVKATSTSGVALQATSQGNFAVQAICTGDVDTINATSNSPNHAAVSASNSNTSGGLGVWAKARTAGYFESTGNFAVQAVASADVDTINATSNSPNHAAVSATNNNNGFAVWAKAKQAGYFEGGVEITGTLKVDGDIVFAGGDCAEEFDVGTLDEIEPGSVVVLDGRGSLRPCEQSYDKKVAGVVSGAGNYRPGMILDRRASSEKRSPVALVGKAYCKADAQYGAIEVGDLLTTSPTRGHAMRVGNPLQAFGAVLGKALRPLAEGQGMIPILIALQ